MTEAKSIGEQIPNSGVEARPWRGSVRRAVRHDVCDIATVALLAAVGLLVLFTYKDYAISNDEGVQHRYGELIIAYFASGFEDRRLFSFLNLYLYGGLFDIVAIGLSRVVAMDPYDLRHVLCALIGIGGIAAAAATARLIAGPRAGLIAAISLTLCGAWYGSMFNHTKDIPFAAAMMGATLFLFRIGRRLPSPRIGDVVAFGVLAGAALGIRSLGLLMVIYIGFAVAICLLRPRESDGRSRWRFATASVVALLPALILAYVIMIVAWPWAGLAPFNPVRGLLAFTEFNYSIRTLLAGKVYDMTDAPRLYVPIYIMIRLPLLMLFGAALAMLLAWLRSRDADADPRQGREIALLSLMVVFPLSCQVIWHGPAFTGMRHFLFLVPVIAALSGIGLDRALTLIQSRGQMYVSGAIALIASCFLWNAAILFRLHPYEYLDYNALVGGLEGASRRYDLDYWFNSMPEAIGELEAYLRRTEPVDTPKPLPVYSVAVCGERLAFEKSRKLPQLHWDFKQEWNQSDFFIAPTQLNCDADVEGRVIGAVVRLGVVIAYVKDLREATPPVPTKR